MKKEMMKLPDSELEVMQAIWSCSPPVSRGEIEKILEKTYPIAQTTCLTLLSRLIDKGYLKADKEGRGKNYIPLVSEQEYLASQSKRMFHKLCKGNISAFASALCDSGLTQEELAELRELLDKKQL